MLRILGFLTAMTILLAMLAVAAGLAIFQHYGRGLPDFRQLADYEPPVMTRLHAGDGSLITEYAVERRVFVPVEAFPPLVIKAFLAAEDKNFYSHPGLDPLSILRAALTNLQQIGSNRRPVGASTITQQVAKNFLLSGEVSIERKIKEAILAFRIERAFSKNRILELYLNEIYLGLGSYGAAAAALNYFDKSLDELTIEEVAFLAALPKAPNNYHPRRSPGAAKGRRDWVVSRMLDEGFITPEQAQSAWASPLVMRPRAGTLLTRAEYFAEEVRRELMGRYGESKLYRGGLSVRTTLDPALQRIADSTLREGVMAVDRQHGYGGPLARSGPGTEAELRQRLADHSLPGGALPGWELGIVLASEGDAARIGLSGDRSGTIPIAGLRWARARLPDGERGPAIRSAADVLQTGDVILVEAPGEDQEPEGQPRADEASPLSLTLRQVPEVNGGLVALDPHTGRILAMSGGFSFASSQFNRVTQAARQPGSAFKPIVYLAGLEAGFSPSSQILDAPFVIDQGPGLGLWKPHNYAREFYGPSTLRRGMEMSRNLMTVRLAQTIGMDKVADAARRLGTHDDLPEILSMSLGAGETTLLRLTAAYAMLVNGGKAITPTLIDRIQDRHGATVFRHDLRPCPGCDGVQGAAATAIPAIPDSRDSVADPRMAYQMVSMLQGVVIRGTGTRIRAVGKPLAGKTGTTNQNQDAWFVGFSPDLAVGVYVGFDQPASLGRNATGSSVAAPIFRDFMAEALKDQPAIPFRIPPGIRMVRVDGETGRPARAGDGATILEAFLIGQDPDREGVVIGGAGGVDRARGGTATSPGLY